MQWATGGKITPRVSQTYELAGSKKAMLAKWNRQFNGKCVRHP
jgi:hypothetical protein